MADRFPGKQSLTTTRKSIKRPGVRQKKKQEHIPTFCYYCLPILGTRTKEMDGIFLFFGRRGHSVDVNKSGRGRRWRRGRRIYNAIGIIDVVLLSFLVDQRPSRKKKKNLLSPLWSEKKTCLFYTALRKWESRKSSNGEQQQSLPSISLSFDELDLSWKPKRPVPKSFSPSNVGSNRIKSLGHN